jgi:2-dehydro-3-deoxygluconokinase
MSAADIPEDAVRSASALHVPGVALQISDSAKECCLTAMRLAANASVPVSFDPNMRNLLGGTDSGAAMEEALSLATLVTPTQEEAAAITGCGDPRQAAVELRARGPELVAVTLAADGAVLAAGGDVLHCAGFSVDVVEPTGAGDVHAAAMMTGMLKGWDLERLGRYANAAGALAVTAVGHLGVALPTPERIAVLER